MQNIAREIDDIDHLVNASEAFQNGQWLPELAHDMQHEETVVDYAITHHYAIAGHVEEDGSVWY